MSLPKETGFDAALHARVVWPHSRVLATSRLALHGPDVVRKVTCENAARVYGFQV